MPFKKYMEHILINFVVTLLMAFVVIVQTTQHHIQEHPSAHGVAEQFSELNYMSIARRALLHIGFSDKRWAVSSIEEWRGGIYDAGLRKIPANSTENLMSNIGR